MTDYRKKLFRLPVAKLESATEAAIVAHAQVRAATEVEMRALKVSLAYG